MEEEDMDITLEFEEPLSPSDRAIRILINTIDTQRLARAFKDAAAEVQDVIFQNMSELEATTLKYKIEMENNRGVSIFEDIVKLDDRAIQKVIREVDFHILVRALKSTRDEVQSAIFRNMSKRAGSMLKEEMDLLGHVDLLDILDDQDKIVSVVRQLEDRGEIYVPSLRQDDLYEEMSLFDSSFADINLLSDADIQKVMREVDTQDLAKSLKTADAEVQDKFYRNMSERAANMLKEDIEFMGSVDPKDVEKAQQKIANTIGLLEVTGDIVVVRSNEDDLII